MNTFNEQINSNNAVLVDFYADWCGPCRMMTPTLNDISATHKVVKVNIDDDLGREISMKYGISAVPTLIVFREGKPVHRFVGLQKKETLMSALI